MCCVSGAKLVGFSRASEPTTCWPVKHSSAREVRSKSSLHIEKTKLAGVLLITPPTVFEDFQLAGEFFAAHNCLLKNGRKTNSLTP